MSDFIDLWAIAPRLKEIQERSGMNAADFCKETDIPASSFSQILGKKIKINVETINKVILRWGAEIDPMWLLFGKTAVADPQTDLFLAATPETDTTTREHALIEQAEEIRRLREALSTSKPKTIDRIMVFYSDNSFECYTISKE